jgi:hypothetical protein
MVALALIGLIVILIFIFLLWLSGALAVFYNWISGIINWVDEVAKFLNSLIIVFK